MIHLRRKYSIKANWILYVDNYLEGFHIPFVHKELNKALDYGQYETELFDGGVLQIGIADEGTNSFDIPPGHQDYGKKVALTLLVVISEPDVEFLPWDFL